MFSFCRKLLNKSFSKSFIQKFYKLFLLLTYFISLTKFEDNRYVWFTFLKILIVHLIICTCQTMLFIFNFLKNDMFFNSIFTVRKYYFVVLMFTSRWLVAMSFCVNLGENMTEVFPRVRHLRLSKQRCFP